MSEHINIDNSYNIKEIEVDSSWVKNLSSSDFLEYRSRWDLASQKHHFFDFPLFLEAEVSYACNYQCPKCPRQSLPLSKKDPFLSNELLDKLFDEAKKYRVPAINFSHGGEPLMRKDLPQLIRKARDSFILDIMFHTNGYLLNRELSIELIESGLTKINFSLDAASSNVYKKVRVGGDYGKVIANINEFLEVKKEFGKSYPRVRVSFVISEENKHEQKKFYALWKDKVNLIAFQQYYDFSKMKDSYNYKSEDQVIGAHCCNQLWQLLTVTCDGDIIICQHDYNHEHVLGNLKTHTIYECWHSDTINKFRELHLKNRWHEIPLCRKCIASVEAVKKNEIS